MGGDSSKCDTDDEAQCSKMAQRAGCEWRSGVDADCTVVTVPAEPGCCYGSSSKCDTDDEAQCDKMSGRAGCEWITGLDADCSTPQTPQPGCCYGESSKCDTDEEDKCAKFATRAGCEWRSGVDADCTLVTEPVEPGCCFGSNSKCNTDDEAKCQKFAARAGCEWITGDDAHCGWTLMAAAEKVSVSAVQIGPDFSTDALWLMFVAVSLVLSLLFVFSKWRYDGMKEELGKDGYVKQSTYGTNC